ncbi:unnamed protein product [Calypogeia fissa]
MATTRVMFNVVCLLLCLLVMVDARHHVRGYRFCSIDEVIPSSLQVPAGNEVQQILFGLGVQIYLYNGTAWNLNNVSGDLYNDKGLKIGHHYFVGQKDSNGGQPTWETFSPVTRVTGKALASLPVTSDSINWVLLQATSNSGEDEFLGATTYIQRLYTQHGNPPSATLPANAGDVFNSSYTSLYKYSANATEWN